MASTTSLRRSSRLSEAKMPAEKLRFSARLSQKTSTVSTPSVEDALIDFFDKNDLMYVPEVLEEYSVWRSSEYGIRMTEGMLKNKWDGVRYEGDVAVSWLYNYSPTFRNQLHDSKMKKHLKKICEKKGEKYTAKIFNEYSEWAASNPKKVSWSAAITYNRWMKDVKKAKKKELESSPVSEKPTLTPEDRIIHNNINNYLEKCKEVYSNYEKNKVLIDLFYYLWENECLNFMKKFQKFRDSVMDKILNILNGPQTNDIQPELKDQTMYVLSGVLHEIMCMKGRELGKLCDCCE
jgi:hypothetical protein